MIAMPTSWLLCYHLSQPTSIGPEEQGLEALPLPLGISCPPSVVTPVPAQVFHLYPQLPFPFKEQDARSHG